MCEIHTIPGNNNCNFIVNLLTLLRFKHVLMKLRNLILVIGTAILMAGCWIGDQDDPGTARSDVIIHGKLVKDFKFDRNQKGHVFYRWFNEFPVILLIAIIILVFVRPG